MQRKTCKTKPNDMILLEICSFNSIALGFPALNLEDGQDTWVAMGVRRIASDRAIVTPQIKGK